MSRFPIPKLNYANVIATIALFVALGGAAVAAGLPKGSVGPKQLKRGAVTPAALRRGAVTSGKIAPKAVTAGKLGPNAVLPGNLGDGLISTEKLGDGAVIARKVKNGVITTNKLQNGAVTSAKLGDNAVNASKLQNGSVTASKLAPGVISYPTVLNSGETLRGQIDVGDGGEFSRASISFPVELPALPEGHVLGVAESSPQCPGRTFKNHGQQTPEAAPGQLCVYVALSQGNSPSLTLDPTGNTALGFSALATFGSPDPTNRIQAFWAVTAP